MEFTLTSVTGPTGDLLFNEAGPGLSAGIAQFALDVLGDSSAIISDDIFTAPSVADFSNFDRETGNMHFLAANGFWTEFNFFFDVSRGITLQLQLSPIPAPAALSLLGVGALAMGLRRRRVMA